MVNKMADYCVTVLVKAKIHYDDHPDTGEEVAAHAASDFITQVINRGDEDECLNYEVISTDVVKSFN
ncbi:hypothetical protein CMI37_05945 [Candidatus Pacearchaeota archaeon]|nr:hypothetical protein [Candidatus Pacearchaeota archaeon]|tara:strand:- start:767 stop:967 length:201 start_codon:yes stop_codon:yes gene_type:complete